LGKIACGDQSALAFFSEVRQMPSGYYVGLETQHLKNSTVPAKEMTPQQIEMYGTMQELRGEMDNVVERFRSEFVFPSLPQAKQKYFASPIEVFARCFSRYVYDKLATKGRTNTYLVREPSALFSPTEAEAVKLNPIFDKLFKQFRSGDLLKKALEYLK